MSLEAQESSLSFDVLTWIEENKKLLKAFIGGTIVLVTVIIVARWYSAKTEADASNAVVAVGALPAGSTNAVPADAWLSAAGKYSGTRAGERALLLGATQLYVEGKYADAAAKFDAFIAQSSESPFLANALLGKAVSLDAQNKVPEALAAYQVLISRFPNEPTASQARLGKARLHEVSNQFDQALAIYEEMSKGAAMSSASRQAASQREALLAKHPELARPQSLTNTVNVLPAAGSKQ